MEKVMVTFIIGLFIGGSLGIIFTCIFALSGDEPNSLGENEKDMSVSLKSEFSSAEKNYGRRERVI